MQYIATTSFDLYGEPVQQKSKPDKGPLDVGYDSFDMKRGGKIGNYDNVEDKTNNTNDNNNNDVIQRRIEGARKEEGKEERGKEEEEEEEEEGANPWASNSFERGGKHKKNQSIDFFKSFDVGFDVYRYEK